tara:strand:+ start:313 stop:621 length:309 start_codon:yes stop_codon:yes gene_type:complete
MATKYLDFYKKNIELYYYIDENTIKNYKKIESSMFEFLIDTEKNNKIKLNEEVIKNIRNGLKLAYKIPKEPDFNIVNKNLNDLFYLIGINNSDPFMKYYKTE